MEYKYEGNKSHDAVTPLRDSVPVCEAAQWRAMDLRRQESSEVQSGPTSGVSSV